MLGCKLYSLAVAITAILVLAPNAFARTIDNIPILIESEDVVYDMATHTVSATRNVRISFQNRVVTTNEFEFNLIEKHLRLPGRVYMHEPDMTVAFSDFEYEFNSGLGEANMISIKSDAVDIRGDHVDIFPDRYVFKEASFTTCCKTPVPAYRLRSSQLTVFPETQTISSVWNTLYIYDLPVLPIPSYIHRPHNPGLVGTGSPVPSIGSNEAEGFYIKQRLGYYLGAHSSGTVNLGYAERFGWLYGADHLFSLGRNHSVTLRGVQYQKSGSEAGVGYMYKFLHPLPERHTQPFLFDALTAQNWAPSLPKGHLGIFYTYRELLNLRRVSFRPLVKAKIVDIPLGDQFRLDTDASIGVIDEYDVFSNTPSVTSSRTSLNAKFYRNVPLGNGWTWENGLFTYGNWYDAGQVWNRILYTPRIRLTRGWIRPFVSYTQKLYSEGSSPFFFDTYNVIENNEFGVGGELDILPITIGAHVFYNTETKSNRELDIFSRYKSDCWQGTLRWKTVQKEFRLEVKLI